MISLHRRLSFKNALLVSASSLLLFSCALTPQPLTQDELAKKGAEDRAAMFQDNAPLTKPLTLSDAIARVLSYNLDSRSKMMDQAMALGQLSLSRYDLLPKASIGGGYEGRSNHDTVMSRDAVTLQPSLSDPYYSLDRDRTVADLSVSWNVLDFGVSYFNAKQNADRALIASERRRKAVASLIQETRTAYWRAVAAQELSGKVTATIDQANKALRNSGQVEKEKLHDPLEALRYQKVLLENLRMLSDINQELSSAKAELAALINVPPGTDFKVAVPKNEMVIRPWNMSIERMEDLAFSSNPDLREQMYQTRISVDETRKAILKMLPGITFGASRNYDSNSFLQDNMWNEASAKISFNLINLLSGPSQIRYANASEESTDARRLALRMAVLAQVHVSRIQYESAASQFDLANHLSEVEKKLSTTMAARQENDAQSLQERINAQTSYIASELRRYQAYARAQAMLGKMQATVGVDLVPEQINPGDLDGLSASVYKHLQDYDLGNIGGAADTDKPVKAEVSSAPEAAPVKQDVAVATPPAEAPKAEMAKIEAPRAEAPKAAAETHTLYPSKVTELAAQFEDALGSIRAETPTHEGLPVVNSNIQNAPQPAEPEHAPQSLTPANGNAAATTQ